MNVIKSWTLFWSFIYISKQHFILIINIFPIVIKHIFINFFFLLNYLRLSFNLLRRRCFHWINMNLFDLFLILFNNHLFNIFLLWTRLESILRGILCFILNRSRTWHHWQFSCSSDSATWSSSWRWHTSRSVLRRLRSTCSCCAWCRCCLFWQIC